MGGWLGHCLEEFSVDEEEVGVEEEGGGDGNDEMGGGDEVEAQRVSVFKFETDLEVGVGVGLLPPPHNPTPTSSTTPPDVTPRLSKYSSKSGRSLSPEGSLDDPLVVPISVDVPLSLTSEKSVVSTTGGGTTSTHPHLSSEEAAAEVPLTPFVTLPPKR